MALSDMLSELAQRARDAEDRARAATDEAKDKVRQRADEASDSARKKADELKQRSDAVRQEASDRWAEVHRDWAKHIDQLQSKFAETKAKQDRAWSQMDADLAADDARAACAFAVAAVDEAESATIDAILAQMEADEVAART
jgi:vacuolar-type H+-ATPase subunit H